MREGFEMIRANRTNEVNAHLEQHRIMSRARDNTQMRLVYRMQHARMLLELLSNNEDRSRAII